MITFKSITYQETLQILRTEHYAHRVPSISFAFGLFENDSLQGVLTFGTPASNSLCIGVAGSNYKSSVIELNRLYIRDTISDRTNLASQFIAFGLNYLKPYNKIVVSYADTAMSHNGYVYQATNFLFTGATPSRTDKYTGSKHSRHYDKEQPEIYRQFRSSKHRYIYITGDKRFKKEVLNNLKYPILAYPKNVNSNYSVGDTLKVQLLEVATGKIITT